MSEKNWKNASEKER